MRPSTSESMWSERVELLKAQDVHNYSIYRHGLLLFACLEKADGAQEQADAVNDVVRRWQQWMEPHMETLADARPLVEPVELVFRLD